MIRYEGPVRTIQPQIEHVRAFLTKALADGVIVLDPHGTILTSELYKIYRRYTPKDFIGITRVGQALKELGSPAVVGPNGTRYRGGIRVS